MFDQNHEMDDILVNHSWVGDHQLGDEIPMYIYIYARALES
jgi:hypothetical protein